MVTSLVGMHVFAILRNVLVKFEHAELIKSFSGFHIVDYMFCSLLNVTADNFNNGGLTPR
jgi:hypothetical protein